MGETARPAAEEEAAEVAAKRPLLAALVVETAETAVVRAAHSTSE